MMLLNSLFPSTNFLPGRGTTTQQALHDALQTALLLHGSATKVPLSYGIRHSLEGSVASESTRVVLVAHLVE